MSLLLRRVCTLVAVAGLAVVSVGCKHNKTETEAQSAGDTTPVIVGMGVSRTGDAVVGFVVTPEGTEVMIETVEVVTTDPTFTYNDAGTLTVSQLEDVKANPSAYSLVVDENKKINLVQKAGAKSE